MGFEDDLQETIRCTLNLPNEKETVRFGLLRRGIEKLSVNSAIWCTERSILFMDEWWLPAENLQFKLLFYQFALLLPVDLHEWIVFQIHLLEILCFHFP